MATAPVTPTPKPTPAPAVAPATAQVDLNTALVALAHKHASVSYWLIGIVVFVLALAGAGGYIGLKFCDAQLARAEKIEEQYNADRKSWQAQTATDEAARAATAAQQQVIVKVVDTRDAAAANAIQNALKPGADVQTVANGLTGAYSSIPAFGVVSPTPDGKVLLTVPQAQQVTASKIAEDRDAADLADTRNLFTLEQGKTASLTTDLSGCKQTLSEADKTITAYRKAAKVSRWKKFLHGSETALLMAGSFYVGHKL